MIHGDCLELLDQCAPCSIDAAITDPPYGCRHGCTGFAHETNFNMQSDLNKDFGNLPDFQVFLSHMAEVGRKVRRILKPRGYFILIIGDRFYQGEYVPLGAEIAACIKKTGFKLKGIKIWSNRATVRPYRPYGMYHCFVPNITHQNIIILQK